jgi:lipopolysaccharide assembly outer membrane protein LptD (OstA)
MRRSLLLLGLAWLAGVVGAMAQFGSFGDVPVSITADGATRFEGGVAIAEDNVQIHYGDYSIYCDYAEYNPDTRDVLLIGNIRLYTSKEVLTGQRALFNLETKQMRALEFSGAHFPLLFHAFSLRAPSTREFRVRDAIFTTDDSSKPDFHVRSKSVRIYPDSRVIFSNSTVYVRRRSSGFILLLISTIPASNFFGFLFPMGTLFVVGLQFPDGTGDNMIGASRPA